MPLLRSRLAAESAFSSSFVGVRLARVSPFLATRARAVIMMCLRPQLRGVEEARSELGQSPGRFSPCQALGRRRSRSRSNQTRRAQPGGQTGRVRQRGGASSRPCGTATRFEAALELLAWVLLASEGWHQAATSSAVAAESVIGTGPSPVAAVVASSAPAKAARPAEAGSGEPPRHARAPGPGSSHC